MADQKPKERKIAAVTLGVADMMISCGVMPNGKVARRVYLSEVGQGVRSDFKMYENAHGVPIENAIGQYLANACGKDVQILFGLKILNEGNAAQLVFKRNPKMVRADDAEQIKLVGDLPEHLDLVYERKLIMHLLMNPDLFPPFAVLDGAHDIDFAKYSQAMGGGDLIVKYDRGANGQQVFLLQPSQFGAVPNFIWHEPLILQQKVNATVRTHDGDDYATWVRGYFTTILYDDGGTEFKAHGVVGEMASVPIYHADQRMAVIGNRSTGREAFNVDFVLTAEDEKLCIDFMCGPLATEYDRLIKQPLPDLLNQAVELYKNNIVALRLIEAVREKTKRTGAQHAFALHDTEFVGGTRGVEAGPSILLHNALKPRDSKPA